MGIDQFSGQMASALNDRELIERTEYWRAKLREAEANGNAIGQVMTRRPLAAFEAELRRRGLECNDQLSKT